VINASSSSSSSVGLGAQPTTITNANRITDFIQVSLADMHQGSAPSFEEDSGVLGVKKELNCVPILLRSMQKGVYSS
jgi:hypothetical protein